uniref:uncharacterized protein LOC120886514 isoform X2 n=1 Tax=Ictidomys tridecemlineatus TaxID=43179 RepID=UPI001A9E8B05|nr:uncharacterized protein LOC120886514 isoform X2 [Ictidomys tridecemlineatus]
MCGAGSRWPLCLRVCGESQEPPGRGWVDRERPHQCSWPRCRCCQDSPRGTSWAQGSTVIYPWETRTLDRQEGLAELIVHPEHGTLLWDVWAPSLLGQAHLMHKKKGTSQMPNGPGPRGDSVQERDRQTLSGDTVKGTTQICQEPPRPWGHLLPDDIPPPITECRRHMEI